MSKHTPGPWGHKTWDVNKDGEFNYTVEKDDKSICEIVGTGEQAEANARLIAAAPELLEALKVCSAELFAQCADHPRAMLFVKEARAAIAKAEGETNE